MRLTFLLTLALICLPIHVHPAAAQTVASNHTIRSKSIIIKADLIVLATSQPGPFQDPDQVAGMEARAILYPGRPIRKGDIGPPAVIERNQIITLVYAKGALRITAEGRALARGGIGDRIKVMNLASRATITGVITDPGIIKVMP